MAEVVYSFPSDKYFILRNTSGGYMYGGVYVAGENLRLNDSFYQDPEWYLTKEDFCDAMHAIGEDPYEYVPTDTEPEVEPEI